MAEAGARLKGAMRTGARRKAALGLSGAGAPTETRAAMSRAMAVLPEPGNPAMSVRAAMGMRLGHSQSCG